jgi:hypothetical protein
MPVFKNDANGSWYVMARHVDWRGEQKQKPPTTNKFGGLGFLLLYN